MYTLEDLKEGDVLDCGSCSQRTVLAVCGKVCCLSTGNDKEEVGGWYTVDNLIDAGIRLHQEPEPKKITISSEAYEEIRRIVRINSTSCCSSDIEKTLKSMVG